MLLWHNAPRNSIKTYHKSTRIIWLQKFTSSAHTLWRVHIYEVRFLSEHDLLQDDSEAVDISFLSSIDRSSCHT